MSEDGSRIRSPFLRSLAAGGIAGTTVDLSLFPIDTLKTRLQSGNGFAQSGGFRGVYKGVGSALAGSAPSAALFFVTYDTCKRRLRELGDISQSKTQQPAELSWREPFIHMIAASLGEIAACAVRVPTEVIKQRAQASQFSSSWAALQDVLKSSNKLQGLYRGWAITIAREVPFTMIQFPLWEAMKSWSLHAKRTGQLKGRSDTVGTLESALFGSVAGAVAAGITTPLDVLKTRKMLAREDIRMTSLARDILNTNGPRAFFAGLGPRVFWISAGGAIFLGSYQWAINLFEGHP